MLRLITILSALFFAGAAAAGQLYVNAPKDGYLNLRAGPSSAYSIIKEMPHGSTVHVIATPGKWFKVKDKHGYIGWAHSHYMSHYPVVQKPTHYDHKVMFVYAPKHGALNLRHGPSTSYGIIGKMAHGTKLKVLKAHGKWSKVKHPSGTIGWAHNSFLSKNQHAW